MSNRFKRVLNSYHLGKAYKQDDVHIQAQKLSRKELSKLPKRFDVINYLLKNFSTESHYLEIGVRYPEDNFNKIKADYKYGVDPGVENDLNPVDFKLTSDEFFKKLSDNQILKPNIKFNVVFIDGLHTAEQTERDINNALQYIADDGYIILHDCNPPTEFHARENFHYRKSPAQYYWNGTTWKALVKFRQRKDVSACCIDTDWGIGVISKSINFGKPSEVENPYFSYSIFDSSRIDSLNLINFDEFKQLINTGLN